MYRRKTFYCCGMLIFLCRYNIAYPVIHKLPSQPNRGLYVVCPHTTSLFAFATMYLNLSCILLAGPFDSFLWNIWLQLTWISLMADSSNQLCWNCLSGHCCSLQNWRMVATL